MNVQLYRAKMSCTICLHQWVAVFVAATKKIDCPNCHYSNDAPPIAPDA